MGICYHTALPMPMQATPTFPIWELAGVDILAWRLITIECRAHFLPTSLGLRYLVLMQPADCRTLFARFCLLAVTRLFVTFHL